MGCGQALVGRGRQFGRGRPPTLHEIEKRHGLIKDADTAYIVHSLTYVALTFLGYPIGTALAIGVVDRWERKHLLAAGSLLMAATGLGSGFARGDATVAIFGLGSTLAGTLFSTFYHVYVGELFPTEVRATAASWCYASSRATAAAIPFVLIPLLGVGGPELVFTVVAVAMVIVAVDVLAFGPRTKDAALEKITEPWAKA